MNDSATPAPEPALESFIRVAAGDEIRRLVEEAREIKHMGDAFFLAFNRPSEAVAFGLRVRADRQIE